MLAQRNTQQRKRMLELIQSMNHHPTADEIYSLMRDEMPRISLGTVYRNLEVLCDTGLLQRVDMRPTQRRFDKNTGYHYHARCLSCDRVFDVGMDPMVIKQMEDFANAPDFEITGHQLEFLGYCKSCKDNLSRLQANNEES